MCSYCQVVLQTWFSRYGCVCVQRCSLYLPCTFNATAWRRTLTATPFLSPFRSRREVLTWGLLNGDRCCATAGPGAGDAAAYCFSLLQATVGALLAPAAARGEGEEGEVAVDILTGLISTLCGGNGSAAAAAATSDATTSVSGDVPAGAGAAAAAKAAAAAQAPEAVGRALLHELAAAMQPTAAGANASSTAGAGAPAGADLAAKRLRRLVDGCAAAAPAAARRLAECLAPELLRAVHDSPGEILMRCCYCCDRSQKLFA